MVVRTAEERDPCVSSARHVPMVLLGQQIYPKNPLKGTALKRKILVGWPRRVEPKSGNCASIGHRHHGCRGFVWMWTAAPRPHLPGKAAIFPTPGSLLSAVHTRRGSGRSFLDLCGTRPSCSSRVHSFPFGLIGPAQASYPYRNRNDPQHQLHPHAMHASATINRRGPETNEEGAPLRPKG